MTYLYLLLCYYYYLHVFNLHELINMYFFPISSFVYLFINVYHDVTSGKLYYSCMFWSFYDDLIIFITVLLLVFTCLLSYMNNNYVVDLTRSVAVKSSAPAGWLVIILPMFKWSDFTVQHRSEYPAVRVIRKPESADLLTFTCD